MSGGQPPRSDFSLRPVTSRKLERLMPARRTPVGASSARALSDMAAVYTDLPGERNGDSAMKITDVSVPLAPPRRAPDECVEGHAFLGSASNSATTDGQGLITHLKPVLMGRNPLHREALVVDLWKKQRASGVRSSGAVAVALWDLLGKAVGQPIDRLLGTYREAVPAY